MISLVFCAIFFSPYNLSQHCFPGSTMPGLGHFWWSRLGWLGRYCHLVAAARDAARHPARPHTAGTPRTEAAAVATGNAWLTNLH